ncbi:hypothetical protein PAXRUDRAFT_833952 [Paxillus rubicundulus Ve08.2h10]|uniref:Zn(2)-C6 fungal-type domain-containing protein n=1 Tax=Paxillus rubicundulus Ve08.2h10 TaxID=930991 RepID=A0A0D0CW49_9AGAM|nr:hypothetical protein PAXRUDRAFT_833952 [Paxillus rubicundulus Ve08.2h10]
MSIAGPSRDIGSLQRGKACLSCRRRKMKCDGIRPICTQCTRGDRAEDCEYTDGNRRPRTLVLEEDIARLRARVQELENPQNAIPSIELYPPYMSPSTANPSVSGTPYQPSMEPPSAFLSTSSPTTSSTDSGWGYDGPPQRNVQQCLTILAPHAAELGLFLNIDRLRAQNTRIFPGLHSTLTLWSTYLSQRHVNVSEQNLEFALLSHAQHRISDALTVGSSTQDPQVFMHIIQTEALISCHLQRTGEPLGARYHASAALSLALGLRLHLRSGEAPSAHLFDFVGHSYPQLPPPLDATEEKERVDAFWTVYTLDRCLGDIYNGPPGMNHAMMITAPWPSSDWSNEGQSSFMTSSVNVTNTNTVLQFLTGQDRDLSGDSPLGLQAKASVLLSEAASIAASYAAGMLLLASSKIGTDQGMAV